uniref:Uncharacterized protein n=1 Tax=Megaviridae environmental sample TaxID=1737588 RepID=A0A5J6VKW0_9VIRU|nr:MAG: hypothetical protein [Megaviridae environmental sample]
MKFIGNLTKFFIIKKKPISFGQYCNKNIIDKKPRNKLERQKVIKDWYNYIKTTPK